MTGFTGKIKCAKNCLNLALTLSGGQSFRWKLMPGKPDKWIGVMQKLLWILNQSDDCLEYTVYGEAAPLNEEHVNKILTNYFRLNVDLGELYKEWGSKHEHFKQMSVSFKAVRILDQDPVENLFSFICSQNNHINRISTMVEHLCTAYGSKICVYEDKCYYAFPTLEEMNLPTVEEELRKAKFGYRAKFIANAVKHILNKGGMDWFNSLKQLPYEEVKKELVTVPGIGPKVADCICLMSLNHLEAIPVDTHIYKIAKEYYLPELRKTKSVTTAVYNEIGNVFRKTYGDYAGWAQTVLFCSDLRQFKGES